VPATVPLSYSYLAGATQTTAHGETTYFWVKAKIAAGESPFSTGDSGYIAEAVKSSAPFIAAWRTFGRPNCWAFKRSCHGDINGTSSGFGANVLWIDSSDLTIFKAAYNVVISSLKGVSVNNVPGICADNNRASSGFGANVLWVDSSDLTNFKQYYNVIQTSVPVCSQTNYNFWKN
jgi:hypothetical protein